jgi:hypothetical protein
MPALTRPLRRPHTRAARPSPATHIQYGPAAEELLFGYFAAFCRHTYGAQLAAHERAVAALDLRAPHSWYPYARAIHRRIVYHGGGCWAPPCRGRSA